MPDTSRTDLVEESRASAEDRHRAAADEVRATIATLTTLVNRMEAVEALRRDAESECSLAVEL
jgi:hypothetical protein